VIDAALTEFQPFISTSAACRLMGKSRATLHRQRRPGPAPETPQPTARPAPSWALTDTERAALLAVLNEDRFADKSPAQVWAVLLDDGAYLASISTMYRVLRAEGQVRERRAQATHPPRVRPELVADGPDQVWSWDITRLKGPWRGNYFDLYVMLDIFSRKAMRWEVHVTENADLAQAFIENAIIGNGGVAPRAVHADRGTSMTSKPVAALLADLHIAQSHSRPHVSNDNPYSEAQFKTLKYCPAFPGQFGSIHDARTFCDVFFTYYNNDHRHSGIGLYTPSSVHDGSAVTIQAHRQQVLDDAYATNPHRFHGHRPKAPTLPAKVWINQPRPKIETEEAPQTFQAA
jgi:putative transposase